MVDVPTPGVARIVKLGVETLLITRIESAQDVPEGEYEIEGIQAIPAEGPGGAGICEVKATCTDNCTVRWGKIDEEVVEQ